jgi:NADH:ubiquinone oxidoreductase subunit 5 (subunit L)/multisubunit Na+/H+ antiporter MnhA subunit
MSASGGIIPAVLAVAVLAPTAAAALASLLIRGGGERGAQAAVAGTALGTLAAAVVLVAVAAGDPVFLGFGDGAGLAAGRLAGVLLVLVLLVGLVVQVFATRYLQGDPRYARFFVLTAVAVSATAAMVSAGTIVVLAVAWVLAGAALVGLLAHERGLPAARRAARRGAAIFTIGDGALVLAAALIVAAVGDLSLRDTSAAAAALEGREVLGLSLPALVATLIVIAALARSAQVPFGSWLPGTVAAPTPVSALLHAGIVNAGGILLVMLAPILVLAPGAILVAFAAGAVTALYGTILMLARADVKGQLAHSTMGQMGFMVVQASLGALSAAIFHLVAHGMYKATLFLGSGSVIHERQRLRRAPRAAQRVGGAGRGARDAAVALSVTFALLAGSVALIAPDLAAQPGGLILLAFAWATAAQAGFWWLRLRRPGDAARVTAAFALLGLAIAAYVGLLSAFKTFLAPDLPAADLSGWAPAWLAIPVLAVAALALALNWIAEASPATAARLGARAAGARRALYAATRRAGDVPDTVRALPGRLRPDGAHPTARPLDPTPARSL